MDQFEEDIPSELAKVLLGDKYDDEYQYVLVTNTDGTYVVGWDSNGEKRLFEDDFKLEELGKEESMPADEETVFKEEDVSIFTKIRRWFKFGF